MQATHWRWMLYAVAAGGLLWLVLFAPAADDNGMAQAVPRRGAAVANGPGNSTDNSPGSLANRRTSGLANLSGNSSAGNRVAPTAAADAAPQSLRLQARVAEPVLWDPFAAASPAQRPAWPLASTARPSAGALQAADAPEPAPPLPFTFLGRWTEQGRTTVFLRRGDKTIPITGLGPIDDRYAVRAIDDLGLLLEHLPSRSTQALRYDAPAPTGAGAAAPPMPTPTAATAPGDNTEDN